MVKGLELFREHFGSFKMQYIMIGGVACDILHEEAALEYRVTKDLDVVLCMEVMDSSFAAALWRFIRSAGYEIRQAGGEKPIFYRFRDPTDGTYPSQLELFSRKPDNLVLPTAARITPIPMEEDISSLSAILLDDDYYAFLLDGRTDKSGITIVSPEHLIPMKAKAFLDLIKRKREGQHVDKVDIRKHRNDVFRLSRLLATDTLVELPTSIGTDMDNFIKAMGAEEIDFKALKLNMSKDTVLPFLRKTYRLTR